MGQKKYIQIIKITSLVLGCLLFLGLLAAFWLSRHYRAVVREQLPQVVARAGRNKYKSSLEDVSINILTRKVALHGLRIWYDSTGASPEPAISFVVNIPHLYISGIDWVALLRERNIRCGLVLADRPEIYIRTTKDSTADEPAPADTVKRNTFPEAVLINVIQLRDAALVYEARSDTPTRYSIRKADLRLYKWQLNLLNKQKDTGRILHAADMVIDCSGISIAEQQGAVYAYTADSLHLDTRAARADIRGFRIKTTVSRSEFYRRAGLQKDIFSVVFPEWRLSGFDLRQLLYHNRLQADTMLINKGAVDVYFSRLPPENPASKLGRFPNQLLLKLPLKLYIPYTRVSQGHASYTEVNEETELPGALNFDALNGMIGNITNDSIRIKEDASCVVDIQGKFNKKSDIRGRFNFLLRDTLGAFSVSGNLKQVSEEQISDAAKALAKVAVSAIAVQELDLNISGNQYRAAGDIVFRYTGLALNVQKIDGETGKMKGRPVLSFLANKLLLYPANPMPGAELRKIHTELRRDPQRSFFNLIWRNIFEGVKATAIRNKGLAATVTKGKEKDTQDKRKKSK